jgi:hypothetical protein
MTRHAFGPFRTASATWWSLVQDLPGVDPEATNATGSGGNRIGIDRFGIIDVSPKDSSPADLSNLLLRRELTIREAPGDAIELALSACLPPDHPFVQWVRSSMIGAPELITRLTGYFLTDTIELTDARWARLQQATVASPSQDPCATLTANYRLHGTLARVRGSSFLSLPGDRLVMDESLAVRFTAAPPPVRSDSSGVVWLGSADDPGSQRALYFFLGSLVFDGSSVQRQGVPYGKLPDIYGLHTSVGYASFAGIIAGVQPVLQLFDWLLSRGG